MTATDVLRRLLDERGVEWHDTKIGKGFITVYEHDGITWIVTEHSSGRLSVKGCVKPTQGHYDGMTPEQAIAATLGTGTCHNTQFAEMDEKSGKKYSMAMSALRFGGFMPEDEPAEFTCSACGETASIDWETFYDIRFCPFCGRKVVSE